MLNVHDQCMSLYKLKSSANFDSAALRTSLTDDVEQLLNDVGKLPLLARDTTKQMLDEINDFASQDSIVFVSGKHVGCGDHIITGFDSKGVIVCVMEVCPWLIATQASE